MFIEPTITWVPLWFSGYILWLDTKIVFEKNKNEKNFTQTWWADPGKPMITFNIQNYCKINITQQTKQTICLYEQLLSRVNVIAVITQIKLHSITQV